MDTVLVNVERLDINVLRDFHAWCLLAATDPRWWYRDTQIGHMPDLDYSEWHLRFLVPSANDMKACEYLDASGLLQRIEDIPGATTTRWYGRLVSLYTWGPSSQRTDDTQRFDREMAIAERSEHRLFIDIFRLAETIKALEARQ